MRRTTFCLRVVLAAAVALAATGSARAQYPNPYYPNPYYPYPPGYGAAMGPGNTLAGGAQYLQASGDLMKAQEDARIIRQQGYQEKLKTKKMAFDLAAYEKANTPSFTEEQEKVLALRIRRVMTQPNNSEIKRGDTLNLLMPYIHALSDQGVPGPPVAIKPSVLKALNLVPPGGSDAGAGLLRNGDKLTWPVMLRGPNQKKLDQLLPEAIQQTIEGTLEPATYTTVLKTIATMTEDVRKLYHKEQIDGPTFLASKDYLDSLAASVKVLQRPDAAKFFDGTYDARGQTVTELVDNMMADGLKFGPARPDAAWAYTAVHNDFVAYARTAQAAIGFQSPGAAPPPSPFNKSLKK